MFRITLALAALMIYHQSILAQYDWIHTDGPDGSFSSYFFQDSTYLYTPALDFLFRTSDGQEWEKIEADVNISMSVIDQKIVNTFWDDDADAMRIRISVDQGESWVVKDLPDDYSGYGGVAVIPAMGESLSIQRGSIFALATTACSTVLPTVGRPGSQWLHHSS